MIGENLYIYIYIMSNNFGISMYDQVYPNGVRVLSHSSNKQINVNFNDNQRKSHEILDPINMIGHLRGMGGNHFFNEPLINQEQLQLEDTFITQKRNKDWLFTVNDPILKQEMNVLKTNTELAVEQSVYSDGSRRNPTLSNDNINKDNDRSQLLNLINETEAEMNILTQAGQNTEALRLNQQLNNLILQKDPLLYQIRQQNEMNDNITNILNRTQTSNEVQTKTGIEDVKKKKLELLKIQESNQGFVNKMTNLLEKRFSPDDFDEKQLIAEYENINQELKQNYDSIDNEENRNILVNDYINSLINEIDNIETSEASQDELNEIKEDIIEKLRINLGINVEDFNKIIDIENTPPIYNENRLDYDEIITQINLIKNLNEITQNTDDYDEKIKSLKEASKSSSSIVKKIKNLDYHDKTQPLNVDRVLFKITPFINDTDENIKKYTLKLKYNNLYIMLYSSLLNSKDVINLGILNDVIKKAVKKTKGSNSKSELLSAYRAMKRKSTS